MPIEPLADEIQDNACRNVCCEGRQERRNHGIHLLSNDKEETNRKPYFNEKIFGRQVACKSFRAVISYPKIYKLERLISVVRFKG